MQETQKECLSENIEHHYRFAHAENGVSTWICWFCEEPIFEFEDSVP